MATVHVLTRIGNKFRCIIHFAVPAGNNSANVSWKTAGLNSGLTGSTVMTEGSGAGQITTAEKATVLSGDVIEFTADIEAETAGTSSVQLGAMVDAEAIKLIAAKTTELQTALKWFGATRT